MYPNLLGQKAFHRLSDDDMAGIIGVSRNAYLTKIRTGRFTADECKTYCDRFKKRFDYLFATNDEV